MRKQVCIICEAVPNLESIGYRFFMILFADYEKVLSLDKNNRMAKSEHARIEKLCTQQEEKLKVRFVLDFETAFLVLR